MAIFSHLIPARNGHDDRDSTSGHFDDRDHRHHHRGHRSHHDHRDHRGHHDHHW